MLSGDTVGEFEVINDGFCKLNRVVAAHDNPVLVLTSTLLLVIFVFVDIIFRDKT